MVLLIHIIIAFSSIVYTFFAFFNPSKSKLYISYAFVAMTIATGTYLTVTIPSSHLTSVCMTGLIYLGIVTPTLILTRNRLAKAVHIQ